MRSHQIAGNSMPGQIFAKQGDDIRTVCWPTLFSKIQQMQAIFIHSVWIIHKMNSRQEGRDDL
jgi:hypothetical protein